MSPEHFSAILMTLVLWTCMNFGTSWPLLENTTVAAVLPQEFSKSSTGTPPISSVSSAGTKSHDSKRQIIRSAENDKKSLGSFNGVNFHRLPPSPANLLKPDRFQFYTYNERGDMITKQMTMQEIQALIAGGGPADHSNTEIQEPQKVEDILTGGKKVMDIVEKVQNVLKSAMGKPATLTGSLPTVPEKANVEWSNILPAILAGDKYGDKFEETHYVAETTSKPASMFVTVPSIDTFPATLKENAMGTAVSSENTIESTMSNEATIEQTSQTLQETQETQETLSTIVSQTTTIPSTEKLMIPVAVITAEQNAQIAQRVTQSPVFQKITEIVSLENGPDENAIYNKKHVHTLATPTRLETTKTTTAPAAATTTTTNTTIDASPSFWQSTSQESNQDTGFIKNTTLDIKNESLIIEQSDRPNVSLPIEIKIKPIVSMSIDGNKVRPLFDNDSNIVSPTESTLATATASISESDKVQLLLTNAASDTFTRATEKFGTVLPTESSTSVHDAPTFVSLGGYFNATKPSKPLSMELADSLSSMINQVSETVPSVLPISSEYESMINSTYEKYAGGEIQTKGDDVSEISTNTVPMIHSSKFPVIHQEKPGNLVDKFEEQVQPTTDNMSSKVHLEQQTLPTTSSPPIKETINSNDISISTIPHVSDFSLGSTKTTTPTTIPSINTDEIRNDTVANNLTIISTTSSDRIHSSDVAFTNTEEATTVSSLESSENSINGNVVNWSKPIEIVDSILATLPTELNTAVTESITLPYMSPENSSVKTLASGLIAGFQLPGSTTTTISHMEQSNFTLKAEFPSATTETTETNTLTTLRAEGSMKSNDTDHQLLLIVSTVDKDQVGEFNRLSNLQKETETLVETTDRTRTVTRSTTEYSEQEMESENTRITGSSVVEVTTTSKAGTDDENEVSPKVTDMLNEYASSVVGSSDGTTVALRETNSAITSTANLEDTLNGKSTEPTVLRINRTTETVSSVTETSVPMKHTQVEKIEANTSESILSSSVGNFNETEERPLSLTENAIISETSEGERNKNQTIIVEEGMDVVNVTVAASNLTEYSLVVTKPTETTPTTISTSKDESGVNAFFNFTETKESTNQTSKDPNDSMGTKLFIVSHASQHTTEQNDFDRLIPSKPSNSINNNSTDMWEKISLHQTTPTTSFSSPSSSSPSLLSVSSSPSSLSFSSSSSKQPIVKTTKKPATISESTTRFEFNSSKTPATASSTASTTASSTATASTVSLNALKNVGGLDISTRNASNDIVNFSRLCNEIAFKFWTAANNGLTNGRSLVVSPFGMISLLAMIFLGARGPTSEQMNEVLGLDNVATFNPHLIFQNVTDTVSLARHQGIANAAFVRELFADKAKVRKLLPFYKEQAQQFYEGLVAEVNFATISDLTRRRTNLLIRKQTGGRIKDFLKSNPIPLRSPLAAISANVFQTDCNSSLVSATGRDGELYFAVSSAHRLRKLIPVPATVWRANVLAGYEPNLDATVAGVGGVGQLVSTIFLLPGQQGHVAPGDTLDRLEQRLVKAAFRDDAWNKLLNVLIPRPGLELQIPKFTHRSVINATAALKQMGLDQLFSARADFKGINGIGNRLFLSDVLQMNLFGTCGDENISNGRHLVEIYPASPSFRNFRYDEQPSVEESLADKLTDGRSEEDSSRNDRQVSIEETTTTNADRLRDKPRLKLDQPFLYFVRHNPTGLILHMGRFNPRLL